MEEEEEEGEVSKCGSSCSSSETAGRAAKVASAAGQNDAMANIGRFYTLLVVYQACYHE